MARRRTLPQLQREDVTSFVNLTKGCLMKKMSYAFLFLLCALVFSLPNQALAQAPTGALQEAIERGTLRVGISSFVPWAMQDKNGEYIGFEIDVARRLAKDFDLELELLPTRWSGIIPALLTGKFDMIICGLSSTPARSLRVNFSIPYDHTVIEAIGRTDTLGDSTNFADFNNAQTIVAVRTGTTAATAAKLTLPRATIRYFDEEAPALQEMLAGRAKIFFAASPLGSFEVIAKPQDLRHVSKSVYPQPISIAVRKGDFDTVNALDSWIRNCEAEGWLKERRQYWFESQEWEKLLK